MAHDQQATIGARSVFSTEPFCDTTPHPTTTPWLILFQSGPISRWSVRKGAAEERSHQWATPQMLGILTFWYSPLLGNV